MIHQQDYSFMDFKFKGILGEGRSGKMLLCEFRGNTITLERRLVEGSITSISLVCYGYYGGGMSFVIGLTIVGTMLSDQKITEQQKSRAIKGLEAIHKHGILYNDIWEENILINDKGALYLIDFGMAS
ncbi:kinase-like domain-containing protein [Rhizophagus irregularis DAOM 181602=DAOM 197198]|nr:kinase-like domain-containing protein [Rhizophagus irregularis DAOM 181602=DAOM 197198]